MEKIKAAAIAGVSLCFLNLVVMILCGIAYVERIKDEDVSVTKEGTCVYPKSPAFVLGMVASFVFLVMQVAITVGTLGLCCVTSFAPSSFAHFSSSILFLLSWVTFVLAMMEMTDAAMVNGYKSLPKAALVRVTRGKDEQDICPVGEAVIFLRAAILSGITLFLSIFSFAWKLDSYLVSKFNSQVSIS